MQDVPHILEAAFETAIVIGGLVYLFSWMGGRRLTNGKALLVFAFGFGAALLLNLFKPVPLYVLLVGSLGPSCLRLLKRLGSKLRSSQINAGPKNPALPEQRRLP